MAAAGVTQGSNDLGIQTGTNTYLSMRQYYVEVQTAHQITWNNTNNVDPTDLTSTICTQNNNVSCSAKEVNIEDDYYGFTDWYAVWGCAAWEAPTVCDIGWVSLNLSWGPYTDNQIRSLICQEVGHGMGLDHTSDTSSCMLEFSPPWPVYLNAHDKNIVNSKY